MKNQSKEEKLESEKLFREMLTSLSEEAAKLPKPEDIKGINKFSLADLISANNYLLQPLEEAYNDLCSTDRKIKNDSDLYSKDQFRFLKERFRLLKEKYNFYTSKRLAFSNEIDKRLFTKSEIILQNKIKLKEFVIKKADNYNLKYGQTVDNKIITEIMSAAQKENLTKSNRIEAFRKILQRLGYSKERIPK